MTYIDRNAPYALNSYLWKLLEANLGWEKINDMTPIIPVAQQPELMQSGKPFIVYGSAIHQPTHLYVLRKEAISYMIYATSAGEVNEVVNVITQALERQDEAAIDVNDWLVEEGKNRGVHFSSIRVTMAEKAEDAAEEEGGFYAGLVMLEARYTLDSTDIQTTGFTT